MTYRPHAFAHDQECALGVLLVNLGSPDAPTPSALRRYLGEFLADPRIVEMPRWLWRLILHGIILRVRPARSARLYAKIWEETGSPLLQHTEQLAGLLQAELKLRHPGPILVRAAMRYGSHSIGEGLRGLEAEGARRILVLPLFPQYSATTVGSVFDAVTRELQGWRWVPELRFIHHYHDQADYIEALASRVRAYWRQHGRGDRLLISFHGIPQRYFDQGDPYFCECHKSGRLLAEALDLQEGEWQLSFQSRFGREPWLQPYTDATLEAWGKAGVGTLDVVCPGFAVDCLETLEEIAAEGAAQFRAAGGGKLRYIPALNHDPLHVTLLAGLVRRHTQGWIEADRGHPEDAGVHRQERARALGAER